MKVCVGCRRRTRVLHQHCRLCRTQALQELGKMRIRGPVPDGVHLTHWQLCLAGLGVDLRAAAHPAPEPVQTPVTWQIPGQLALFQARHDFTQFDRQRHANPDNPMLAHARTVARQITEIRGWSHYLLDEIDDALIVLLSGHAPGDRITYTEVHQVDQLGLNVSRTAEVLDYLGLLDDDRHDVLDAWLTRKLASLAPAIAADTRAWADTLRHGGPRSKPRAIGTIRTYLRAVYPALTAWSRRYDSLRQVTRDDIRTHKTHLSGLRRRRCLVGLRSLFRYCKRTGRIFRDPTTHLRTGNSGTNLPQALPHQILTEAIRRATTPAARLILALTAIHAARPIALRNLTLDDLDFHNRRITIHGHTRRLDDLTAELLTRYLANRQQRWPHTLNRHLFLNEQTGHDQRPVSSHWLSKPFHGIGATLNQIRMDRQLEEALTNGPDALHLAVVFGISERAAIRYANAARDLLTTHHEELQDRDGFP